MPRVVVLLLRATVMGSSGDGRREASMAEAGGALGAFHPLVVVHAAEEAVGLHKPEIHTQSGI
jgi:hypothetical protein